MYTNSQSYFQFMDLPITHEINSPMPLESSKQDLMEFVPTRVSQKLLQNKIRRLEIDEQKRKQKEMLLQKRQNKEKTIFQFLRRRELKAQEQRQIYLRNNSIQNSIKFKDEQRQAQSLSKFHASEALITRCRQKVEQKKQEYVARIHNKTRERHQRALERRQILHQNIEKINDEVNLQQWKSYQTHLMQKHKNDHSPPDRLYQQYKKKRENLDNILKTKQKQNVNMTTIPAIKQSHPQTVKSSSSKNILFRSRKVQYFGVHQQDMVKKTQKDILKMRKFIQQNSCALDPSKDEELLQKFESFLLKELLEL